MKKITMNEKTKKIIGTCVCVVLALLVASACFFGGYQMHKETTDTYTINATIVEIIEIENDINEVYFETDSGHIFYIATGEIFGVFEDYVLTFKTNDTATFDDDIIIGVSREIKFA